MDARAGPFRCRSLGVRLATSFDSHVLVHNRRQIARIDTLWRSPIDGSESHWMGRTCKVYALVEGEWKMTMQTGALRYDDRRGSD